MPTIVGFNQLPTSLFNPPQCLYNFAHVALVAPFTGSSKRFDLNFGMPGRATASRGWFPEWTDKEIA
jgi:hypothetical protein